jgi:hypothetical protein
VDDEVPTILVGDEIVVGVPVVVLGVVEEGHSGYRYPSGLHGIVQGQ